MEEIAHGDRRLEEALEDIRISLDAIKLLPTHLQASIRDSYSEAPRFAFGSRMCSFVVAFLFGLVIKEI